MGKSMRRTRSRGMRGDVMEVWQTPKQSMPAQIVGVLIRWRTELVVATVLVVYLVWLNGRTDEVGMWVALLGPVAVVLVIPPSRRFVVSRFWCVVDRHRLRTCLRNAKIRTMNLDGALPFMLWARPTKTGERVWLWTRAGSSADDLENVLGYIAPACFAREARILRKRTMSTLVAVEIIRRDPLARSKRIESRFTGLTPHLGGFTGEGTEPITAATITPIPAPRTAEQTGMATPIRKTTNKPPAAAPASPAVVVNGEDLSDYID